MRELSWEEENKLANFKFNDGYIRSEYGYTRAITHDVDAFLTNFHEVLDLLRETWPDGEDYWFPLLQSLQYDAIEIPDHLNTFAFQSHLEAINLAALALEEACYRFLSTIKPHPFNMPGYPD